jgi:hypothetical protein
MGRRGQWSEVNGEEQAGERLEERRSSWGLRLLPLLTLLPFV